MYVSSTYPPHRGALHGTLVTNARNTHNLTYLKCDINKIYEVSLYNTTKSYLEI